MLKMDRRSFIAHGLLASVSPWVPGFLQFPLRQSTPSKTRDGKILIVIQLSGGNDGLNMIVPYQNEIYYRSRPEIAIDASHVQPLDQGLGLNHALSSLNKIYENGEMSILNAVGYPNPDRSHFRSMDIWQSASGTADYIQSGWLGRYLDSHCESCAVPYHAIEISDNLSLALHGREHDGFALQGPEKLQRTADNVFLKKIAQSYDKQVDVESNLNFLYKTMIEAQQSATYLSEKARTYSSPFSYPNHVFGEGMRQIAELITAGTNTKIYYISLPGFDTHVRQLSRHNNLLNIFAESVATFIKDLKSNDLFDDVLMVAFSEFGRRVAQNSSAGTDHGAANNVLLFGDKLKTPGISNTPPNLENLQDGDVPYTIDFRSIYAQVLEHWLDTPPQSIISDIPAFDRKLF